MTTTKKLVPPQADGPGTNDERAEWAEAAIVAFEEETRTERGDALCDLLADLGHWADRNGFSLAHELIRARDHYTAETINRNGVVRGTQFDRIVFPDLDGRG